jgi:hypothetical protein
MRVCYGINVGLVGCGEKFTFYRETKTMRNTGTYKSVVVSILAVLKHAL